MQPALTSIFSDAAIAAFVVIPVLLVLALLWGIAVAWRKAGVSGSWSAVVAAAAAAIGWMALTWRLADAGVLREWQRVPPPFALFVAAIVLLAVGIASSRLGSRLARGVPLWALVAVQAFRLPLELAMHVMVVRGIAPEQMSYTGRNFDIVTGATAPVVALLLVAGYGGRRLARAWNIMGLALLINVVIVAVLSMPAFAYFGDDRLNVWVMYPPFVWLPAVMVLAALAGHLVIFRALSSMRPTIRRSR